ncbi:head-to-tail connector protein [Mycobacterium phage Luchador]|uniref:Head-to-tail connector protein n=1 Tax=Mycobacterium phage Luchador TaxID=1647300 RepID=A0A0F6YRL6_9CAUD|nr:head-to-tail connector protein [Mycobacterium phage Luchador]AKF14183.1 head-to-tail connector protein [Mycobacterium phage Luchador]
MFIRSALNGGLCEVDEEFAEKLIASGQWVADGDTPAAEEAPKKRTRRTKAQIEADNAAAAAEADKTEE